MTDPRHDRHRRFVAYVERFQYFGRGKRKLTREEFEKLEDRLAQKDLGVEEAEELKKLLLRD